MLQRIDFHATLGASSLRCIRMAKQVLRKEMSTVVAAGAIPALMQLLLCTFLQISHLITAETSILTLLMGITGYVSVRTMARLYG